MWLCNINVFRIQILVLCAYGWEWRSKDTHKVRQICNLFILFIHNSQIRSAFEWVLGFGIAANNEFARMPHVMKSIGNATLLLCLTMSVVLDSNGNRWRGVWFWICTKHCSYFGTSHTEFFNRVGCRKRAKCGCFLEIYCDFHSENISNENQANIGNRFTIVWLQVEVFTAYLERNGLNDCISWIFRPQSGKR